MGKKSFRLFKVVGFYPTIFLCLILSGCATYQGKVMDARRMIGDGRTPDALVELEKLAAEPGKDQLVYLFDYATALQIAGEYKKSNEVFEQADRLSELKDYHSVTAVTGSLLGAEEMVQYKGDSYEKIMINAMKAINYLMLNQLDEALVEARRLNEKLEKNRVDNKKKFEQNVFAVYLSAMIWESSGSWDDAYIAYEKAYSLDPSIPFLKEDLLRAAVRSGRDDKVKKWSSDFQLPVKPEWKSKEGRNLGEIVLIYQQGWGPRKRPRPEAPRFPELYPVYSETENVKVTLAEGGIEKKSEAVYSVEDVAIKTLNDDYAALVAKRMAAIATKEVVADQVRQKNELLGALLRIGMHLSDRADLRQWSTLPRTFQLVRMPVPAGTYKLSIVGMTASGSATGESLEPIEVVVKPRKKSFLTWRSVR